MDEKILEKKIPFLSLKLERGKFAFVSKVVGAPEEMHTGIMYKNLKRKQ